jgi:hypothetical protein
MKYRKKPVVIDAVQYKANEPASDWYSDSEAIRFDDGGCFIRTLEGDMRVSDGDWVIRGIKGEIYPCKPDIFEATYEAAA